MVDESTEYHELRSIVNSEPFKRYAIAAALFWTFILSSSFYWNFALVNEYTTQMRRIAADADTGSGGIRNRETHGVEFPRSGRNSIISRDAVDADKTIAINKISVTHIVIWFIGLCGLAYGARQIYSNRLGRRRAENALVESEKRFRDIAQVSGDWIWEMDARLQFSYLSDRFYDLTGLSHGAFIGETRSGLAGDPALTPEWQAHLDDLANHRPFRFFEYSALVSDGRTHHFLISGKPVFDNEGEFVGYRGTGSDITLRKEAEQKAAEKTAHLQSILDVTPMSISLWDTDRRFVFVNKRLADNLGGVPEDYIGENIAEMRGVVSGRTVEDLVREVLLNKQPVVDQEFPNPRRPGRFNRYSVVPIFDADGAASGALAVGQDVTAYENALAALRRSEEVFRNIVDHSPTAIVLKDLEGRFEFVNKRFLEWYDVTESEVLGKTSIEFFADGRTDDNRFAKGFVADDREIFETGETTVRENSAPFADETIHTLSITRFPVFNAEGEISGLGSINSDITEKKKSDREASEKSMLLQIILDAAPVFITFRDAAGRFEFVNQKMVDEWGGQTQDYIGNTADEVFGVTTESTVADLAKEVLKTKRPVLEVEIRPIRRPGRVFNYSFVPVFGDRGEFLGVVSIGQDVTAQRKSENAVRESETLLRSIIDNSPTTISMKGLDGRFKVVNEAFLQRFGADPSEIIGLPDKRILDDGHFAAKAVQEQEVLRTGEANTEEREGILASGEKFHRLMTKFPVRNQEGEIVGLGTIGADLLALREAEKSLHVLEDRFSEILRIAPEAIVSADEQGNILVFNEAASRIFGYDGDEVIGQPLGILLPPEVRKAHGGYMESFASGSDLTRLMSDRSEIRGQRKDGGIFPAEASISKLQSGQQTIFTVTMHDITERKQVESTMRLALVEAQKADRAKQDFLANMSHELRTPLNAIIGFSEVIELEMFGALGNERYSEYIRDISSSAGHLLALVKDILDLSKIEAGTVALDRKQIGVGDVVLEALRELQASIDKKELHFEKGGDVDDVQVFADANAVRQIVTNLLANAVKFTPVGGRIGISVASIKDGFVDLCVWDTGIGIAEADIQNILKPFTQAGDIRVAREGGAGLGLSIVKALAELHGGRVDIDSTEGEGTRICVSLPTAPSQAHYQ